jgi:hypothetical protein
MTDKNSGSTGRLVTAEMLQNLPEPVQRYMTYTGVVGKPWIDNVHLNYTGRFRHRWEASKNWFITLY